jgi:hypothetical protein|tara:strand:+ start:1885 stop:2010 length:126 start_codon:yes stop_codon:yes gene_type:complete
MTAEMLPVTIAVVTKPKLHDQVSVAVRVGGYTLRTEQAYVA